MITNFKIFEGIDINNMNILEIGHDDVRKVATYLENLIGLEQKKDGYDQWLTSNWVFNHNPKEAFYCSYYFYFENEMMSKAYKKMKKYLKQNNIKFRFDTSRNSIVLDYNLESFLYILVKSKHPEYTDKQIHDKIDFSININKYNL